MRMRLHVDSTIGDEYIYPIYDIDFDKLSALSGYTVSIAPAQAGGYEITKWYVSNNTGVITTGLPGNVPRFPEQAGNILPQRFVYTEELGGVKYLEKWFDPECWERVTTQPGDWATSTDYVKIWSTSGTYRYVWAHAAGNNDSFDPASTYKDLKKMTTRVFYTDRGGHFAVFKVGQYAGPGLMNTCAWGIGAVPSVNTPEASQKKYCFVSDITSQVINTNLRITRSTNSASAGGAINSVWIFVHYQIGGKEHYGVAEIFYQNFADNPVPTALTVVSLDKTFWSDNLVPGGVPGEGSWGGKSQFGGGSGTWSWPSDTRGDGSGAIGEAIATEARGATDAFFTGANGFKLHQILPADIPDIYGALYSSNFLDRYQHAMYSPLSAVLSVHMIPAKLLDLAHATTNSDLTLSGYNVSTQVTHKQYPQIPTVFSYHLNKITLDVTDTFLDYAPYTNAYLHLPYIGVLTLDINAIAAGELAIDYITDAITGNCSALVWCKDRDGHAQPKYVAQGNCSYSLPMFTVNQDGSALGRLASSALGLSMAVATGNAAGAAAGVGSLASGMFDAATAKQNTQITGSFSGNAGMISDTMCWLEIVRPMWCEPEHYQMINGIPSQISGTLANSGQGVSYAGYLRIVDIDTDGIQATDAEIKQIDQLLKAGIFVNIPEQ